MAHRGIVDQLDDGVEHLQAVGQCVQRIQVLDQCRILNVLIAGWVRGQLVQHQGRDLQETTISDTEDADALRQAKEGHCK